MRTDINLETITDGKLYDIDDMAKADTEGCGGCNACCYNSGDLIVLTPFDVYEIATHMNVTFDALLTDKLNLQPDGKITLPRLKMQGKRQGCNFLNQEGRCSIHGFRPNICRLFPLGRVYDNQDFKYFLQVDACVKPNLKLIKVRHWIGIENYEENKSFLLAWQQMIKALTFRVKFIHDDEELKAINDYLIETFYRQLSTTKDFYTTFYAKLPEAKKVLGII